MEKTNAEIWVEINFIEVKSEIQNVNILNNGQNIEKKQPSFALNQRSLLFKTKLLDL